MDAVRISDGSIVALKQVHKSDHPREEEINRAYAMSGPLIDDPHNHSAPVYEILHSPLDEDIMFIVMPYLVRIFEVKYATVGEAIECFRQLFEVSCFARCIALDLFMRRLQGLQFMHNHGLVHR